MLRPKTWSRWSSLASKQDCRPFKLRVNKVVVMRSQKTRKRSGPLPAAHRELFLALYTFLGHAADRLVRTRTFRMPLACFAFIWFGLGFRVLCEKLNTCGR